MHGAMYRVASIRFTYSSVARRRMRIVLSRCDVITFVLQESFTVEVVGQGHFSGYPSHKTYSCQKGGTSVDDDRNPSDRQQAEIMILWHMCVN